MQLRRSRGLVFVHPYDDPDVIAGQGTIGMEIVRQHRGPLDAVFVPVGGGGLISGIAAYVKQLQPADEIIGVEPVDADAMTRSPESGTPDQARARGALRRRRRGEAGRQGDLPARAAAGRRDGARSTPTRCARRSRTCSRTRAPCSSPPARSPSPARKGLGGEARLQEQDPRGRRLRRRTPTSSGCASSPRKPELGEHREAVLAVTIPEQPGQLQALLRDARRKEHHRVRLPHRGSREAHIFVGIEVGEDMRYI